MAAVTRRVRGTGLYRVSGGKRKRISVNRHETPRRVANSIRVGVGSLDRGAHRNPTAAEAKRWKPKKGRKKGGARRKVTFLQSVVRFIRVVTVKKSKGRRR